VQRVFVETLAHYGNAAAPHPMGRAAAALIDGARARIARALGVLDEEIVFTSGGTESNNQALAGSAALCPRGHLVVGASEHKSVLAAAHALERGGHELTLVAPRECGAIASEDIEAALREDTCLVSVMWANNETGICQPVGELAALCRRRKIRFHCDGVAAFGKLPIDLSRVACDLFSLSGHKFHGPKGTGVLFVRSGTAIEPLLRGCGHQKGLRSSTENTAAIVALAEAAELAAEAARTPGDSPAALTQDLFESLRGALPNIERNGKGACLPNTLNVHFPGAPAHRLQALLAEGGFSVAAGASAASGSASHVLLSMGHSAERASQSLRFSLGSANTAESVAGLVQALVHAVHSCRTAPSQP
jgi:cysteine desulfurase